MKKLFVLLPALAVVGVAHAQVVPTLGAAQAYSVFGVGNTQMTMSSGNTVVTGNVAVGPNSSLDFSGGGHIIGGLYVDPSSSAKLTGGSSASMGVNTVSLSQAAQDAIHASQVAASDAATMNLSSITNGTGTINASGALSVLDVSGDVNLSGGHTLTLNGSANDFLVINVDGSFTFSGGSKMDLTGGLTANHILWNFVGSGQGVNFNGNSTVDGTFLAIDRDITVSGGIVNGAVIGSENHKLKLQSGPKVNGQPVPEPVSMLLLAPGLLMLRRKRKQS